MAEWAARKGVEVLATGDFAVLYRTDGQAGAVGEVLQRVGIPFRRYTDEPLAGDARVAALLEAYDRQTGRPLRRLEKAWSTLPEAVQDTTARLRLTALATQPYRFLASLDAASLQASSEPRRAALRARDLALC
ncbi:MAG TPA: hypothetical protein VGO93_29875 [Candidatus Xenobia bacterium]|jgi:superfamily I DNA/RNA helicase